MRKYLYIALALGFLLAYVKIAKADEYLKFLQGRHHDLTMKKSSYFDRSAANNIIGPADLFVLVSGSVSAEVTDPSGRVTSKERREIPGSKFGKGDFNKKRDGIVDAGISIPIGAEYGTYQVRLFPLPEAKPEDRFILEISVKGYLVRQVAG